MIASSYKRRWWKESDSFGGRSIDIRRVFQRVVSRLARVRGRRMRKGMQMRSEAPLGRAAAKKEVEAKWKRYRWIDLALGVIKSSNWYSQTWSLSLSLSLFPVRFLTSAKIEPLQHLDPFPRSRNKRNKRLFSHRDCSVTAWRFPLRALSFFYPRTGEEDSDDGEN